MVSDRPESLAKRARNRFASPANIFFVVAQRRDIDRDHVKPVVKVFAKRSIFERGAQVAVGGSQKPNVDLDGARAAQALEFALLQHAEKFDLDGGRHVSDFIKEERAFVGEFEFARLAGGGSGERSFFVAEKFALQKIFRDGGAVDLDEGPGSAPRLFVDGAGNEVFAHSAFSAQQNGGVGGRNAFDGGQHFLHFGADRRQCWDGCTSVPGLREASDSPRAGASYRAPCAPPSAFQQARTA